MLDRYSRDITYLRISVTDRCNLRCVYCMPKDGIKKKEHSSIISYENIVKIVKASVGVGIKKIRLTGGEPLVRSGIEDLVSMIDKVDGIEEICMTTNGTFLAQKAVQLKKNGLDRVNVSLDTLDPERYRKITRIGDIKPVFMGIDKAIEAGLGVKINLVVLNDTSEKDIEEMRAFCAKLEISLQLIQAYNLDQNKFDTLFDRPPRCEDCNRIRLLSDGKLKPCLHSNIEIDVDFNDIQGSIIKTIMAKPERGYVCVNRSMSEIGG